MRLRRRKRQAALVEWLCEATNAKISGSDLDDVREVELALDVEQVAIIAVGLAHLYAEGVPKSVFDVIVDVMETIETAINEQVIGR